MEGQRQLSLCYRGNQRKIDIKRNWFFFLRVLDSHDTVWKMQIYLRNMLQNRQEPQPKRRWVKSYLKMDSFPIKFHLDIDNKLVSLGLNVLYKNGHLLKRRNDWTYILHWEKKNLTYYKWTSKDLCHNRKWLKTTCISENQEKCFFFFWWWGNCVVKLIDRTNQQEKSQ